MTSEKSYSTAQRLDALFPGTPLKWNPLNAGWSVRAPFTGAWATYYPLLGRVFIDASMATDGSNCGDGTEIAKLAHFDADGNNLWPAQGVVLPLPTDRLQSSGLPRPPALHIGPGGSITVFGISTAATRADCCASYTVAQL